MAVKDTTLSLPCPQGIAPSALLAWLQQALPSALAQQLGQTEQTKPPVLLRWAVVQATAQHWQVSLSYLEPTTP
jgi:hypothetical protein